MRNGMWSYLEHVTQKFERPIKRDDRTTWVEYQKLYPKHSMLLQQYQVGHHPFVWQVRQNPKVVDIYSKIWSTKPEDLLTSFDGASFHFPPEETNRGWYRNTWYHTDQSYIRPDFECVQSWVTAYDVDEGDATLAFMEGSNKYHGEFTKSFTIDNKSDWYKHTEVEQRFYEEKGCCWILNQRNLNKENLLNIILNILKDKSDLNIKKSNLEKLNFENTWNDVNQKIQRIINEN